MQGTSLMGILGKRKDPIVTTPPMTIVAIKKEPVKKSAVKRTATRPAAKTTPAHKQLEANGYFCFYKNVEKKGGGTTRLYFWAKKAKSGEGWRKVFEVPDGKVIHYTTGGLPVLANKGSKPKKTTKKTAAAKPAAKKAVPSKSLRPQCAAVTPDGKQCRNSARGGSKYCGSHKGYRPKTVKAVDTKPRTKGAKNTKPVQRDAAINRQVTRKGYLLYKSGPRFFFSKRKTAQKGWKRITKIPTGFKVKVTDNGLPVLARK